MNRAPASLPVGGPEMYDLLRQWISGARRRVWATQFLVDARPDRDRHRKVVSLLHAVAEAAHRGVDTRLILPVIRDDTACGADMNEPAARFLLRRGVDVRRYAPTRQRPHSHSKTLLVDDHLTMVGNANWTPRSFSRNSELTLAASNTTLVQRLSDHFQSLWGTRTYRGAGSPLDPPSPSLGPYWAGDRLRADPFARGRARADVLAAQLEHRHGSTTLAESLAGQRYLRAVVSSISNASTRIWVLMAGMRASSSKRLMPILDALRSAQQQGRDVRVLFDDEGGLVKDFSLDARQLSTWGIATRPWRGANRLHARAVLVDERVLIVGSVGWTPQSVYLSEERSVLLHDRRAVADVAKFFDRAWNLGAGPRSSAGPRITNQLHRSAP